jgi:asparagine synthase (glutamine-hydrolysing)
MDQPTVDGINTFVVSQATKQAGITVALSGLGGDELFAGYDTFTSVPRMMRFRHYLGWLAPLGNRVNALLSRSQTNRPAKIRALAAGDYYGGQPYFLSRTLFLPATVRALLPSFAFQNGNLSAPSHLREVAQAIRRLDPVNQVCVLEGSTYMANTLLRDSDCMSMAHALEVRTPLLHHPLWEYVLPLAGKLKLDTRLPKPLLLRAAGQRLPEEIYRRDKMGFTLPFQVWMQDGLKAVVERELLNPGLSVDWPLDAQRVAGIWKAFVAGNTSWSRPWALFALKQWIRKNMVE